MTPLLEPEVVETVVECIFSQTGDVALDTLKIPWEATMSYRLR